MYQLSFIVLLLIVSIPGALSQGLPVVTIAQPTYSVTTGGTVTLICTVSATPTHTNVFWQRIDNGVASTLSITGQKYSGSTVNNPSLTIFNTAANDITTYTCSATNAVGTGTSQTILTVTGSLPVVSIDQPTYSVVTGQTVTLGCTVSANPAHTSVFWQRNVGSGTQSITIDGVNYSGSSVNSPSLTVINANTADTGTYTCFAINSVGTGQSSSTTLTVSGTVPTVTVAQSSYIVKRGTSVQLVCTVSSTTTVTSVYWQRTINGVTTVLKIDNRQYSGSSTRVPSLTVINADTADSGSYTCFATNAAGTGNSAATPLFVHGKFCSAITVYDLDLKRNISFGSVVAGDTASSTEICITDKRPLANVTCLGASLDQEASYGKIKINRKCVFNNTTGSNSTTTLQRLAEANVTNTTEILANTYNIIRVDDLTSLDVIYTATILTNVAESTDEFDQKSVEYAADIVNTIIGLSDDILVQAQDAGSGTTRLVEALETISNNIVLDETHSASIVRPFVASEIREFSSDTNLVVGLQLLDSPEVTITNSSLTILEDEINLDILVTDAAIVLPKSLLQSANTTRLLLQMYSSTKLFKTRSSNKRFVANGNIAAATLTQDQKRILNLGQEQVKTVFRPFKQTEGLVCGYWDYGKNDNSGDWSTDGCRLQSQEDNRTICVCNHLTNFAILIDFEAQGKYVEAHQLALSIITIIGLVLSIIGLSFTIICFLIFKPLRKTRGQKVLFQLAIAMLCSWVVFLAGVEQTSDYNGCICVAILLHYFILVTFMWLLLEGLLQYLRFVKVLGTYIPRFMLKASLFAWGVPLIPVIVVCAIDYRLYDGGIHYCWMSLQPFYYAFALPVGLVILTNIIVFILVIVNIVRRPAGLQSNQPERKRNLRNFWAAISIFVLLGVTWIFGYMAIEDARIPFQYVFTICNAFQGFFIFLLFITRNAQVRKEWTAMCCGGAKKDHTGYDSSAGSRSKDSTAFSDLSSSKETSLT